MNRDIPAQAPLLGLKVLDLSRVLAGPWAGQLLADYGADVIKVERPGAGDDTRAWGPPWWGDGETRQSAYFLCANRGKRSIAIDIASPEGQTTIRELAREADVLLENYKVGQLARYGLDADSLRVINPGLIYCSITGYGQTGPYADRAGYDFAIQGQGGLMSITGEANGEPQKVGVAVVDLMTGVYATTAILAALQRRVQTGLGCHIDAALLDVQVAMLANQASNYLVSGKAPRRMGNAHPNIVPYQAFPTADGHLVLAVGNDGQFQRFCAEAGAAHLGKDPDYATNADRVRNRAALVARITELLASDTTAGWVARLEAAGVPCSPILNIDQVFDDPQVQARGMALGGGDEAPGVATPMLFDGQRPRATSPAPHLDADAGSVRGAGWLSRASSGESRS